jgi:hypothetical protein
MEAIGHDHGFGEVLLRDRALHRGQIHAHNADLFFAFEAKEIRLQGRFRAA